MAVVSQIRHGDHIDYLVEGYLHHPHAGGSELPGTPHAAEPHTHKDGDGHILDGKAHCDVHGEVRLLEDDVLTFMEGMDLFSAS